METSTARDLIREAERRLKRSPAIDHWPADREKREATALLGHVLGMDDGGPDPSEFVPIRARRRFRELVRRRAGGEPVAHIVGWIEFRGLRLAVRPGTFVPRQSSEFLVDQAVHRLRARRAPVMVDVATGVGPIALASADAVDRAEVHGVDLAPDAVQQARKNARALGLSNALFHRGDLFAPLPRGIRERVDVVTLHPPYVPREEIEDLPLEVKGFEPVHTLTDFSDLGMGLTERTAAEALDWLRPGGWLLVEVSPDRARTVRGLLQRAGYRDVRSTKGWPEITRVIVGRT